MQVQTNRNAGTRVAKRGFTLVELLVVISIIALLIAILLPSLSKARDQAKTVVCATRIKGLLAAMSVYATDNKDYIAGSPNTSGSVLFGAHTNDEAGMMERWRWNPIQVWDWGGGLAASMGIKFSTKTHEQRYLDAVRMKVFKCPSNKVLCMPYENGLNYGAQPMPSYNTSRNYMWPGKPSLLADQFAGDLYWSKGQSGDDAGGVGFLWGWRVVGGTQRREPSTWAEASKPSYLPRVDQIGSPAEKVFMADGGRYVKESNDPQYDARPWAGYGGAFCDVGPYSYWSRAWNREAGLPGEVAGPEDLRDARIYSYRHGKKEPYLRVGNYRMNVGFFDNHVETMNDIKSANPHFWLPRGFRLYDVANDVHTDVMDTYMQVLETDQNGKQFIHIR